MSCWLHLFTKRHGKRHKERKNDFQGQDEDVFEEVKLRFLIIGHTHEDIDGCFGYLSKKLREQNN
jgi:hypothetical protein